MNQFRAACPCEFQVEGSGRRGIKAATFAWATHDCQLGALPSPEVVGVNPEVVGVNRGAESLTQIQTQDGRWLEDRGIPEIQ